MIVERGLIRIGILAGGRSSRMEVDKALLTINGETMLERTVRIALETGLPVAVSGRDIPSTWPLPPIPFISDLIPYPGPLHGILRLLEHFRAPVLSIGCDMPLVTSEVLEWLIEQAGQHTGEEGLAVIDGSGVVQPLFSLYLPAILARLDSGSGAGSVSILHSAREVIETGLFERVAIPKEMEAALRSVDTPDDYEALRRGSASNPSTTSI